MLIFGQILLGELISLHSVTTFPSQIRFGTCTHALARLNQSNLTPSSFFKVGRPVGALD